MSKINKPPSIKETAFECPHCGVYTTQFWFKLYAKEQDKNSIPIIPTEDFKQEILNDTNLQDVTKNGMVEYIDKMINGIIFLEDNSTSRYVYQTNNLNLSCCYSCSKFAVWVHDNLLYPSDKIGVQPNQDLPEDIAHDFNEARSVIDLSPRGAAALLRLCIQKLCKHLGEKGVNLDDDIASLVSKGLNPTIQKSLDIVRVIGNESVHPGTLDLKDDRDTALKLLSLINSIADQMISHPKQVQSLYEKLPENKRKAIDNRDKKNNNN